MTETATIFFWFSILTIVHTYIVFPLIIALLSANKKNNKQHFSRTELPPVTVFVPAYNEEKLIETKLRSVFASNYPPELLHVWVVSDVSDDKTDRIVQKLTGEFPQLIFFRNPQRLGKPTTLNTYLPKIKTPISILTDANVLFAENTVQELVKHFKNKEIGLVDSQMRNTGLMANGISKQESAYISREVQIKHNESKLWQTMMGLCSFSIFKAVRLLVS